MSHLGKFFRSRRVEKGMSLGRLAELTGYRNMNRGRNRISKFEGGGKVAPDLLAKLVSILEVSPDEIRRLAAEDYRQGLSWANKPIRPYVVLRYMACVYQRIELPDDALDPDAAELFASRLARERRLMVCVVLSRRLSVGFDATGTTNGRREAAPEVPCEPFVVIGGKRFQFDFTGGNSLRQIDEPSR
jgi:transcriptional regulator with XRE-family HTH domain